MKKHVLLIISLAVSTIFAANCAFAATSTVTCPSPLVNPKKWTGSLAASSCPTYMVTATSPVYTCNYTPIGKGYCNVTCNCTGTLKPTGTYTPPPPPVVNDVAKSGLSPPKTRTVNYPTTMSNSTPIITTISGPNVALKPCPNDPLNITTTQQTSLSTSDLSPIPTDINQKMPLSVSSTAYPGTALNTAAPDEQCVVSSRVDMDSNQNVTRTIEAVCPDGYAQVGMYSDNHYIPEVYYNPAPTGKWPVNIKEYNTLKSSGYSCAKDGYKSPSYMRNIVSNCAASTGMTSSTSFSFNVPINVPLEVTKGGMTVSDGTNPAWTPSGVNWGKNKFAETGVIVFTELNAPPGFGPSGFVSRCYVGNGGTCAFSPLAGCTFSCTANYGTNSSNLSCTNNSVTYDQDVLFEYQYLYCTLPGPGFVKTGRMIPATKICARIKAGYKNVYPQ